MNDDHPKRDLDALTGEILDGQHPDDFDGQLTPDEKRRVAELQLIDSLLRQAAGQHDESTERNITAVLARLQETPPEQSTVDVASAASTQAVPPRRRAWWSTIIAASVVLILAGVWMQSGPKALAAQGVLQAVQQYASQPIDRLYKIIIDEPVGPLVSTHPEGQLWVRGSDQFVMELKGLTGTLLAGSDGSQTWFLRQQGGPVFVMETPLFNQWAQEQAGGNPLLTLNAASGRLGKHYDLQLNEHPDDAPAGCVLLEATSEHAPPGMPQRILFWADPHTGISQRIELFFPENTVAKRIVLEREAAEERPDTFYSHADHHQTWRIIARPDRWLDRRAAPQPEE